MSCTRNYAATIVGMVIVAGPARDSRAADVPQPRVLEEFNIANEGGLLVLPLSLDGMTYRFSVDTGCTTTLFDQSLRPALGKPVEVITGRTHSVPLQFELFEAPAAKIGALNLRLPYGKPTPRVACKELNRFLRSCGDDIYGDIGMSFLRDYVVRVDFERGKLSFLDSPGIDAGVPVSMQWTKSGLSQIHAELPGQISCAFDVDTGFESTAGSATLPLDLLEHLVKAKHATKVGSAAFGDIAGSHEVSMFRVAALRVGQLTHTDVLVQEQVGQSRSSLGLGYLSRCLVTFDFPRQTLYLKPNKRFSQGDADCTAALNLGVKFISVNGQIVISAVGEDTPAAWIGVKPSDVLVAVNGIDVSRQGLSTVHHLLHTAPGRRLALSVKRGTRTLQYKCSNPQFRKK